MAAQIAADRLFQSSRVRTTIVHRGYGLRAVGVGVWVVVIFNHLFCLSSRPGKTGCDQRARPRRKRLSPSRHDRCQPGDSLATMTIGTAHVYALPKNDLERDIPLPDWVTAAARVHIASFPPRACTLPWEKVTGRPQTHSVLFREGDGDHVRYRNYSELVWKPAIAPCQDHPRAWY
jgi:hypothetical protein